MVVVVDAIGAKRSGARSRAFNVAIFAVFPHTHCWARYKTVKASLVWTSARYAFAGALVVGGALIWNSRLDFSPEAALRASNAPPMTLIDPATTSDLTSACNLAERRQGWLLFVITASLKSDNVTRGFFQTAIDEQGLYIEYAPGDSAMLRVGITSDGTTKWVPIRTVRRNEEAFIALAVRPGRVRVVTNAVDTTTYWSDFRIDQLRCDAVRTDTSDQIVCEDCNVTARYLAGSGGTELNDIMNSFSNRRAYETKRWLGNGLLIFGILMLISFRKKASNYQALQDS